eukprot:TRINITY_DN45594_c0_g1_i1.p1 TRINITY_DN45594_c0_g1~~TRINITY_DN45594_c0_g1_i1.p1  ORF type:complete len:324 (+),score=25.83 TRINITY_DN45594_c0_g1_i1:183-1154(+)
MSRVACDRTHAVPMERVTFESPAAVVNVVLCSTGLGVAIGMFAHVAFMALPFLHASFDAPTFAFASFVMLVALFHLTEFLTCAMYRSPDLRPNSFLMDNPAFNAALVVAGIEFGVRRYLVPSSTLHPVLIILGLFLTVSGLAFRVYAMAAAGVSFRHFVQEFPVPGQRLVATGPYRICRHPAYLGFLLWAVGTQVTLHNPVSFVLYAAACIVFFRARIATEEAAMLQPSFFGASYHTYAAEVPFSGVPFAPGVACLRVRGVAAASSGRPAPEYRRGGSHDEAHCVPRWARFRLLHRLWGMCTSGGVGFDTPVSAQTNRGSRGS